MKFGPFGGRTPRGSTTTSRRSSRTFGPEKRLPSATTSPAGRRGADFEPGGEHQANRDVPSPRATPRGDGPRVSKTTKDGEATFGHYMIGVFDALGQSRKLQAQTEVPLGNDEVERERLITNLKDTAGVVIGFRKLFRKFFEGATQSTGLADYLPEPQRTEMLAATASEVLLWGVSDAIFVAVPLARTRHPAARVGDVRRLLLAAGSTWLCGLSTGHPIRGGAWRSVRE